MGKKLICALSVRSMLQRIDRAVDAGEGRIGNFFQVRKFLPAFPGFSRRSAFSQNKTPHMARLTPYGAGHLHLAYEKNFLKKFFFLEKNSQKSNFRSAFHLTPFGSEDWRTWRRIYSRVEKSSTLFFFRKIHPFY
jgi:hypothetical protein